MQSAAHIRASSQMTRPGSPFFISADTRRPPVGLNGAEPEMRWPSPDHLAGITTGSG